MSLLLLFAGASSASASEGTLSETLDGATLSATASLTIQGAAAVTLDGATVEATGTNPNGGEPEATPVGGFARSKKKPVRRKFVFENGITVWATDERLARLMAGIDARAPESPQEAPEPERAESPAEEPEAAAAPPALESVPVPAVPSEIVIQSLRDRELQRRRDAAMAALARQALEREESARAALAEEQARAAERAMAARRAIADEEEAIILQLLMLEDA